jgi:hypothetical protein
MKSKFKILNDYKCCLCGETFTGYGNNPFPLSENPEDRCCDTCNILKVIPARIHKEFVRGLEDM